MPREKREAGARGGAGAKKRARTPASGASSRRARDREASEDHDDAVANASSFPPSTLPPEVLDVILSLLDHDSAFQCALVCRAWRDVALAPDSAAARRLLADVVRANAGILAEADALAARAPETGHPDPLRGDALARWETCRARELRLLLAAREMTTSGGPGGNTNQRTTTMTTTTTTATTATTTTTSPRQLYADVCAFACYDCREMRDALDPAPRAPRTTAGTLRVRLCVTCSRGYARWRPTGQRLVTATAAKERYGLRPADLAGFRYGLDTNPVDPGFAPMKLYRRMDARTAAMARWGSGEALEAELRKRMLGDR